MKYENILWIEDSPDILGEVLRICSQQGVSKDSLFTRTVFAPDYHSGAELVRAQEFDLYVLDGDFPDKTSETWKSKYWDFMELVSTQTKFLEFVRYFKERNDDRWGEGYIGHSTNNFSRFFSEFLSEKSGKTVVYSVSTIAPTVAFHHGLPFYSKALDKELIEKVIAENIDYEPFLSLYIPSHITPKSIDFLNQWEYGSRFDFVERYLI